MPKSQSFPNSQQTGALCTIPTVKKGKESTFLPLSSSSNKKCRSERIRGKYLRKGHSAELLWNSDKRTVIIPLQRSHRCFNSILQTRGVRTETSLPSGRFCAAGEGAGGTLSCLLGHREKGWDADGGGKLCGRGDAEEGHRIPGWSKTSPKGNCCFMDLRFCSFLADLGSDALPALSGKGHSVPSPAWTPWGHGGEFYFLFAELSSPLSRIGNLNSFMSHGFRACSTKSLPVLPGQICCPLFMFILWLSKKGQFWCVAKAVFLWADLDGPRYKGW